MTDSIGLRVTDATGTTAPVVEIPAFLTRQYLIATSTRLVSGTAQDGWWESSFTNAVTGTWAVRSAMPQDIFGYDGTPPIGLPRTLLLGTMRANPVVPKTLTATTVPKISGTVAVGKKLTAVPRVWSPAPVTLKYQWLRNGGSISTATASPSTPSATDLGKKITLKVTGSKTGYNTVAKTSASTVLVAKR